MQTTPPIRLKWLARFFVLWALLIFGRLIQLQVVEHENYRAQAVAQQERVSEIAAPRGAILDRDGERLAMSVPCESVCVNPRTIADLGVASEILSKVLSLDRFDLHRKLLSAKVNRNGFVWIKRKLDEEEAKRLHALNMPWIEFRTESKRVYANDGLAAHVLGGVDFEEKGESGVEQALNEDLTGQPGQIRQTRDARQLGYLSQEDAVKPGKTIRLTIQARLQHLAEQELAAAVIKHKCKSGSIVAMDPKTGEILALANYPSYDPNIRPTPGQDNTARQNLAVVAPFEPGSVFKVITISAAIETGKVTPTTIIPCGGGSMTLFGRVIHDHNAYSQLAVEDVLARSSNIGAINIGIRIGNAGLYDFVRRFGFGTRTGIALPGESAGRVRPLKIWQGSSIGSVAMGHEISVTSVQLAQACSVIANGGYLVKPVLVKAAKGEVKSEPGKRVVSPETTITMRRMMEGVVIKPYGTGFKYAHIPGYTSAGKTGTAQIYDVKSHSYTHLYNASFMGFAPATNPSVVVVVTVNGASGTAGYGGPASAPVFAKVAEAALRMMNVPQDLPTDVLPQAGDSEADANDLAIADLSSTPDPLAGEQSPDQRAFLNVKAADNEIVSPQAPRFLGLTKREAVRLSAARGIPVEFRGAGLVRNQFPAAGEPLPAGTRMRIDLGR